METVRPLYSVIEKVPLESITKGNTGDLLRYFTDAQLQEIGSRPLQSIAGVVAVKKALVELCTNLNPDTVYAGMEPAFDIESIPNTAPRIRAMPQVQVHGEITDPAWYTISISHTKTHAFGLAVFQRESHVRY